jgi:hypothetical protein
MQAPRERSSLVIIALIAIAYLWMSTDDLAMQERSERHRQETIAAAKLAAHRQALAKHEATIADIEPTRRTCR